MRELALLASVLVAACTRTHELASSDRLDGSVPLDASSEPDAGPDAQPSFSYEAGVVYCGARPCECSNGLDDDGDGELDGFDPECTGAFDDAERDFATGLPDDITTSGKCQDCYFDYRPGRDACSRPTSCALDGTATGATGACRSCAVPDSCVTQCAPLVPNGCDCFGCCEVSRGGERFEILLAPGCSADVLSDPARCRRCTRTTDCYNPCEGCELCPGRTVDDLPASCAAGFTCEGGRACTNQGECGDLEYCQFGCCITLVI